MKRYLAALIAVLFVWSAPADARKHRAHGANNYTQQVHSNGVPGIFDYYVLSLSWSPEHCKEVSTDTSAQCALGSKLGFVLHGLWPQYEKGWPHDCSSVPLPANAWSQFPNVFPSQKLMQHEWPKHGTCSGLTPAEYIALSGRLKDSIRIPATYIEPQTVFMSSQSSLVNALSHANPELVGGSIAVGCSPKRRGWLQEVHLCFNKAGKSRACSAEVVNAAAGSCPDGNFKVLNAR